MRAAGLRDEWGYPPRRPFMLLGIYFAVGCLQLLLTVWQPPLPETRVDLNRLLAGVSLVQLGVTMIAGLRLRIVWLPYLIASGILVVAASTAGAAGGQGQLVAGLYLAVLGLFAGYFLPVRAVRVLLLLATVTYGAALAYNLLLDSIAYVIALVFVVIGVTLVVSSLVQQLRSESFHDPLTGALNRRGLQQAALTLHDLDERRHEATTVVEIDLNGFKAYNDAHGHQAGDELLASAVRDWTDVLRKSDVLSRTGGDEFVLLLPATGAVEAQALLARMREVNDVQWSAGVTTWEHGETWPAVLGHADAEMYRAKAERPASN